MLAVRLGEHHHLDVGRIAPEAGEDVCEVGDLAIRQRETLGLVHARKRGSRVASERHVTEGAARMRLEQALRLARLRA